MAEDYCELCDLPLSQCIHGQPPPPPPPARSSAKPAPSTRARVVRPAAPRKVGAPAAPSRRTAQHAFRPHILRILQEHGGRLAAEDMLAELGTRMDDVLLSRDRETSPQGELRWQTAARAERKAMIDEGLVLPAQPGFWELTDEGHSQPPQ